MASSLCNCVTECVDEVELVTLLASAETDVRVIVNTAAVAAVKDMSPRRNHVTPFFDGHRCTIVATPSS